MNKQPHMNENVIAGNVRGIRKRDAYTCWDEARLRRVGKGFYPSQYSFIRRTESGYRTCRRSILRQTGCNNTYLSDPSKPKTKDDKDKSEFHAQRWEARFYREKFDFTLPFTKKNLFFLNGNWPRGKWWKMFDENFRPLKTTQDQK